MEPEIVESNGRKRSPDKSSQTDGRADGPDASDTQTGQVEGQSGETPRIVQCMIVTALGMDKEESRPQMRVLQQLKRDDETKEEIRTPTVDSEEIHEVIAEAWQDILRL